MLRIFKILITEFYWGSDWTRFAKKSYSLLIWNIDKQKLYKKINKSLRDCKERV